jgi:3-oxoacyl-[acyl-carrier-protein] synthase I
MKTTRDEDVVVVATGARTPLGLTAESSAAAVRAGIARIGEHPVLVDDSGQPLIVALDGRLGADLFGAERLAPLATAALVEATRKVLGVGAAEGEGRPAVATDSPLAVFVALPDARPGLDAGDSGRIARSLGQSLAALGVAVRVESPRTGHAGALHGIAKAVGDLRSTRCSLAAVGGVESYMQTATLRALAGDRRLGGKGVRSGFHPGEGAGFVVLALDSTARRLGLRPLAKVRGAFAAIEERTFATGREVLGEGLAKAIAGAAADLALPGEAIDDVFCDINGERYRSEEWGMAVLRVQGVMARSSYEAPANLWGDVGAAWGALGCILSVRAWERGYARGPRALVWGSSDSGLRAAVVLQRPDGA